MTSLPPRLWRAMADAGLDAAWVDRESNRMPVDRAVLEEVRDHVGRMGSNCDSAPYARPFPADVCPLCWRHARIAATVSKVRRR